jgi:enamine deaminase RidA (YjgF/YER057c/UK114 family)
MNDRQNISSGVPWEKSVGYSRAVRVNNFVFVAGTVASDKEGRAQGKDSYDQCRYIFEKIEKALREAGAEFKDVVRTRAFLTDAKHIAGFQKAHGEVFSEIRPAATAVIVKELISPEFLVEIEVDAVVG